MIDPQLIRNQPELILRKLSERNSKLGKADIDKWIEIDSERSEMLRAQENLNRKKNELAELGKQGGNAESMRELGRKLKEESKLLEDQVTIIEQHWKKLLMSFPNIHLDETPVGISEDENVVVKKVGTPRVFDFPAKDHVEIATTLGIVDFDSGSKVSGSQFYFLKNDAVRLEAALWQFAIDFFTEKGYDLFITPDLAKSEYYLGTGYDPRGDEAQTYEIDGEDLGLIATAEVTMAGLHANEILDLAKPRRYVAISHCFRKEAGAYGKYSRGLYRVHQFTKVEMFSYCKAEDSAAMHAELLANEEELLQRLELPYQVLEMCSGDLGAMAARKYDLEAWMPGRDGYGEVTSTSNCTDYQSRNLNIKYRDSEGKLQFAHTLNGTAIVMSRIPLAIIENYQRADGKVDVPVALQRYMGKNIIG